MSTNRRGSLSTPSIPTLVVSTSNTTFPPTNITNINSQPDFQLRPQQQSQSYQNHSHADSTTPASSDTTPNNRRSTKARGLVQRAISFGQLKLHLTPTPSDITSCSANVTTSPSIPHSHVNSPSTASSCAIEVLALIFRHLMDRRSILNCSLVSTHWYGPARLELARLVKDMPFNGFGLVHAIRMRFAEDTFPFLSMTLFDKHVCDLSQLYYHSNPDTKEVFAPAHAPDMLYHLFWTFLFIDQEFRHPKARPKVTCAYFVRLLRNEGGGYPRKYFDKKVLKSIYNDIRSRPLLPAPHVIRALQDVEGPFPNVTGDNIPVGGHPTPPASNSSGTRPTATRSRQSSFMSLAGSLRFEESIRRIQQWWRTVRDEGDQNQIGWVSHVDPSVTLTTAAESETVGPLPEAGDENGALESTQLSVTSGPPLLSTLSYSSNSTAPLPSTNSLMSSSTTTTTITDTRQRLSNSSTFPHGSLSTLDQSIRMKFGSKSDMSLGHSNQSDQKDSNSSQRWAVMNQGYTTVSKGWRAEGDGLDCVVRFPKPTKPSAPADRGQLIRCASILDMELVV